MEGSRRNSDLVETIITLSNRLGLAAIAEGVETLALLDRLPASTPLCYGSSGKKKSGDSSSASAAM